jgi:hypothetical protein
MRTWIVVLLAAAAISLAIQAGGSAAQGADQLNPKAQSNYVTDLANVSSIFGSGRTEDVNIIYVSTGFDRYVEIANEGTSPLDMTDWRLVNSQDVFYIFPEGFVLAPGEKIKVHDELGPNSATDLYTNSIINLIDSQSDVITLMTDVEATASKYSYPGPAPKSNMWTAPVLVNASNPAARQPGKGPVLVSPPGTAAD